MIQSFLRASLIVFAMAMPWQIQAADTIDAFFDRFTADWVRGNPDLATSLRYFSGDEQDRLERQLTPLTRAYQQQRTQLARKGLDELARFDRSRFDDTQRVSADLMQWLLEAVVKAEPYRDFYFPLQQFSGANVDLVETFTLRHPLNTPKDAENFVARLALADDRMNEVVTEARQLADKGMLPPRFIVQATLASMRTFADAPVDQNPLVTVFAQKAAAIAGLPADKRAELQQQVATLVQKEIYPSWQKAIVLLDSIGPKTTDDAGLWRFNGGDAAYANSLQRFTTTTLTPEEIHQIGLRRVDAILSQMDGILRQLGRTEGTVQERMKKLEDDLRYPDPTSDASREQIMKDIDGLMKDAVVRSTPMFARMPTTPVIAQPFPRFREASAAANYNRAPLDGSRPAIFQMPLRVQRMTRLGLRTLVYHETIPGHHFQIALEQENAALPRFRQARALGGISAMSEGWALYAEKLAAESGWYDGDPEGLLGQLSAELWRARRLVVDTGLHAKKWTRQQAIDYGIEASEIDRYVVNPGQACSYMIGQLRILEIRDHARKELGDKFSLRDFHSTVLNTGTTPLGALEKEVERYVRSVKGK
ncbi:DUF885 domain-containing protein [Povalibacter sp.]|uniref:DUF885 domain-containing protein n=1 Tax=Povalibacter sp. TaxID=1962978 RepID=UPI002F42BF69